MPVLAFDDYSQQEDSLVADLQCYNLLETDNNTWLLEDSTIVIDGEPKAVDVEIHSSMEKSAINVDENEIKEAYYKAMSAYENEMTFDDFHNPIGTYDYSLVGENETYFYEQTADDSVRPHMDIFVLSDEEKLAQKTDYAERLLAEMGTARSSTGYFGKMYVENTTKMPSSCSVLLPANSSISVNNGYLYIYGGFSGGQGKPALGSVEADLGLQYSNEYHLWRGYMLVAGDMGYFLSNYSNATYKNGYLPNTTVSIVSIPYNTNRDLNGNNTNTLGSVVLKVYGTAKYADKLGNGGNTPLTTIMESNNALKLTSVKTHKWVVTLSGDANTTGHNIGKFSNVSVDGIVQPSSAFKQKEDGTVTFSGISKGAFTIDVRH